MRFWVHKRDTTFEQFQLQGKNPAHLLEDANDEHYLVEIPIISQPNKVL